jgi:hypothetical protein
MRNTDFKEQSRIYLKKLWKMLQNLGTRIANPETFYVTYLFMIYLTTLSVAKTTQRRMTG